MTQKQNRKNMYRNVTQTLKRRIQANNGYIVKCKNYKWSKKKYSNISIKTNQENRNNKICKQTHGTLKNEKVEKLKLKRK